MFRSITAVEELASNGKVATLLPTLVGGGVSLEDAMALAHHVVLLFYVLVMPEAPKEPSDLLKQLSLDEIASLCARYYSILEQGELGYGREEEFGDTSTEITKA